MLELATSWKQKSICDYWMVRYLLVLRCPRRRFGETWLVCEVPALVLGDAQVLTQRDAFTPTGTRCSCNATERVACQGPVCTEDPTESSNRMLYKPDVVMAEIPKSASLYVLRTVGRALSPH